MTDEDFKFEFELSKEPMSEREKTIFQKWFAERKRADSLEKELKYFRRLVHQSDLRAQIGQIAATLLVTGNHSENTALNLARRLIENALPEPR